MKNTFLSAPLMNANRGKFTIIGNEAFEAIGSLSFKSAVPCFKGSSSLMFKMKGDRPNKARKVINDVYTIKEAGT